jgi:hypothetical protein
MHHQCRKDYCNRVIVVQNFFDQSKNAYMYYNRCRCSCTNCNPVATVSFCQCRSRFPMELCMGTHHPTKLSNGTAFLQHQLEHQIVYWELLRAPQNDMIGCKATNINHIYTITVFKLFGIMSTRVVKDWSITIFFKGISRISDPIEDHF